MCLLIIIYTLSESLIYWRFSHRSPSYPSVHAKLKAFTTLLQLLFSPTHCLLQISEQFVGNGHLLHAAWKEIIFPLSF